MTRLLSPNQLADLSGFHLDSIYRFLDRGEFPNAVKLAGRWRIPESDYLAWISGESPSPAARSTVASLAEWRALRPQKDKEDSCV